MPKRDRVLELLNGLRDADDAAVVAALGHKQNIVVAKAALVLTERGAVAAGPALVATLGRLLDAGPEADKGNEAKAKLVDALHTLRIDCDGVQAVLHRAACWRQVEASFDTLVDTAASMRGIAGLTLAELGAADVLPLLVDLLHDEPRGKELDEPSVRMSAARALGLTEHPSVALLLRAKLRTFDEAEVEAEVLAALATTKPAWLIEFVTEWAATRSGDTLALSALALSEQRTGVAFEVLRVLWPVGRRTEQAPEILLAFAALRTDEAVAFLVDIAASNDSHAEAARTALRPFVNRQDVAALF